MIVLEMPAEMQSNFQYRDVVAGCLYDSLVPTSESNCFKFFVNVGPESQKTIGECNVSQSGHLPMPQEFLIKRVFIMASKDDLEVMQNWGFILAVGNKYYMRRPVRSMAQCSYPSAMVLDLTSNLDEMRPMSNLYMDSNFGVLILERMRFMAELHASGSARPSGRVYVFLDGIDSRGIC